jgi:multicomponent Na+:H+ antiporter subunit C
MSEYFLCLALFTVGLYAVLVKRNIVKILIGISIMGYAVNLLFLLVGDRVGAGIPILRENAAAAGQADPVVQAVVLITVILGLVLTLLLAALVLRIYGTCGTLDIEKMKKLKG